MAREFCKTWWGKAWLQALSQIDFSNRIPRGARYARNGSVKSVSFEGNIIKAKVQGSRRTPYKVEMAVNKFSATEIDRLMDCILKNPSIVPQLLNMNLSPAVLNVANASGLKVFPESWKDLGMACSCPDWAVPCKHIAAVVYMIGLEIDNNPFLVFQLHGVDLLQELKKRGIGIDEKRNINIPVWKDALNIVVPAEVSNKSVPFNKSVPEFGRMPELGDALMCLLPDEPPFYSAGDFKQIYAENLKRARRAAERLLDRKICFADIFEEQGAETHIILSPTMDCEVAVCDGL